MGCSTMPTSCSAHASWMAPQPSRATPFRIPRMARRTRPMLLRPRSAGCESVAGSVRYLRTHCARDCGYVVSLQWWPEGWAPRGDRASGACTSGGFFPEEDVNYSLAIRFCGTPCGLDWSAGEVALGTTVRPIQEVMLDFDDAEGASLRPWARVQA